MLRGGKEAARSNQRLVEIMSGRAGSSRGRDRIAGLQHARFGAGTYQGARTGGCDYSSRRSGLITFVTENSAVPVIETGAGNCHIFVDDSADFEMADRIVINAKTQRPSVCNAAEKVAGARTHRGENMCRES